MAWFYTRAKTEPPLSYLNSIIGYPKAMHRVWASRRAWYRRWFWAAILAVLLLPFALFIHPALALLSLLALLYPTGWEEQRALGELDRRYGLAYRSALEAPAGHPWRVQLENAASASLRQAKLPKFPWVFASVYLTLVGITWLLPPVKLPSWIAQSSKPAVETGSNPARIPPTSGPAPSPTVNPPVTNPGNPAQNQQQNPNQTPSNPQAGKDQQTAQGGDSKQSPDAPDTKGRKDQRKTNSQDQSKPSGSQNAKDQQTQPDKNQGQPGKDQQAQPDRQAQPANPGKQSKQASPQSSQPQSQQSQGQQSSSGKQPDASKQSPSNPQAPGQQTNPQPPQTQPTGQDQQPGQNNQPSQPNQTGQPQNGQPQQGQPSQGQNQGQSPGQQGQGQPSQSNQGSQNQSPNQQGKGSQAAPTQPVAPIGTQRSGQAPLSGNRTKGPPQKLPNPWASGTPPQNVQRQAEKYLENEPLPPEVRDIVRRYFELPQNP